jgi:hypothetical protein
VTVTDSVSGKTSTASKSVSVAPSGKGRKLPKYQTTLS